MRAAPGPIVCGLPGPRKQPDLPELWTCNRMPDHPLPHRVYDPRTYVILAEWSDQEVGQPKKEKRWGRK